MKKPMSDLLDLTVAVETPEWERLLPEAESLGRIAGLAAFAAAPHPDRPCEAGLVLADDKTLRRLNKRYRGKDKATNVLSFPAWEGDDPAAGLPDGAPVLLGDLVVAAGVLAAEAADQGKPLADHFSHLVVHGILHLMGYDHERGEREAAEMENLERRVLAGLGIPDPYGDEGSA